ncbi:hypothetical protein MMPV_000175 [Pyropia vietnamensis]
MAARARKAAELALQTELLHGTLFGDLSRYPPHLLDALYAACDHAAPVILRALPPTARLYLVRLAHVPAHGGDDGGGLTPEALRKWARPGLRAGEWHERAVAALKSLRVLLQTVGKGGDVRLRLNPVFGRGLRAAMAGLTPAPFGMAPAAEPGGEWGGMKASITAGGTYEDGGGGGGPLLPVEVLSDHARRRWEGILHFLVALSGPNPAPPSDAVVASLIRSRVLEESGEGATISSAGFQFLLKSGPAQLCVLLRDVMAHAGGRVAEERRTRSHRSHGVGRSTDPDAPDEEEPSRWSGAPPPGETQRELVALLFALSATVPGRAYPVDACTPVQRDFLPTLAELGVVLLPGFAGSPAPPRGRDGLFYPTPVGVSLVGSAATLTTGGEVGEEVPGAGGSDVSAAPRPAAEALLSTTSTGALAIVVENNYRVYAYTTSPFQMALLGLFVHIRYRMPNVAVGTLTRSRVTDALANGITAAQIIRFLNAHAHPRMKGGRVPPNVADQVALWAAEKERVRTSPAVLLSGFAGVGGWTAVAAFATDLGAKLWEDREGLRLAIEADAYDEVREFVRDQGIE